MDVTDRPAIQYLKENIPAFYKEREVNGKVYQSVIDSGVNANAVFYNQVIFDKLKLSVPTTMEEFYELCEVIKKSGVEPLVFGAGDWSGFPLISNPYFYVDLNNKGIRNNANALYEGTVTIPQIYENTLTMLKRLADGGYVSKASATLKYDQSVQYFADGKAAMLPQGSWIPTLDAIKQADPAKFKLNSFMLPYPADPSGNINISAYVGYGMSINAKTKYPEQAKKAFDGLTTNESIKLMVQGMGSTTSIPGITLEVDPAFQKFTDQLSTSNVKKVTNDVAKYVIPPSFEEVFNAVQFNTIVKGDSVEKSLKALQTEWDLIKGSIKKVE
ncbi:unnamed protein product [Aphanomyces euteiches]